MPYSPHGIAGVSGRMPIGVAVTLGRKSGRGFPVDKDYFHLMEPHEAPPEKGQPPQRRPHPRFDWWNTRPAPREGEPSDAFAGRLAAWKVKRRTIRGTLAHATWSDVLRQEYMAFRPHSARRNVPTRRDGSPIIPPNKQPWCRGDGRRAVRYTERKGLGPVDAFEEIACPAEECPFRNPLSQRKGPECKPSSMLHFRLTWSDALMSKHSPPTVVAKFVSGGWRTFRALLGLKEDLDKAAAALADLGYPEAVNYSPMGLPFVLSATEGTGKGTRYPYVNVSPDVSAPDFIMAQIHTRRALGGASPAGLLEASSPPEWSDADSRLISGPLEGR